LGAELVADSSSLIFAIPTERPPQGQQFFRVLQVE